MTDKKVKDLLTAEEKAEYYKIKSEMQSEFLRAHLRESELYEKLYNKCSQILLKALNREIERRESEGKYLSDEKTSVEGTKREIAINLFNKLPGLSIEEVASVTGLDIEEIRSLKVKKSFDKAVEQNGNALKRLDD